MRFFRILLTILAGGVAFAGTDRPVVLRQPNGVDELDADNKVYVTSNGSDVLTTTTIKTALDTHGSLRVRSGSPSAGYVLVSGDSIGSASWGSLSSIISNLGLFVQRSGTPYSVAPTDQDMTSTFRVSAGAGLGANVIGPDGGIRAGLDQATIDDAVSQATADGVTSPSLLAANYIVAAFMFSQSGAGVFGRTIDGVGVLGKADDTGTGVRGDTEDGVGVFGTASGTGNGGKFTSTDGVAVRVEADGAGVNHAGISVSAPDTVGGVISTTNGAGLVSSITNPTSLESVIGAGWGVVGSASDGNSVGGIGGVWGQGVSGAAAGVFSNVTNLASASTRVDLLSNQIAIPYDDGLGHSTMSGVIGIRDENVEYSPAVLAEFVGSYPKVMFPIFITAVAGGTPAAREFPTYASPLGGVAALAYDETSEQYLLAGGVTIGMSGSEWTGSSTGGETSIYARTDTGGATVRAVLKSSGQFEVEKLGVNVPAAANKGLDTGLVLSSGTVTVSNSSVTSNSIIFVQRTSPGGTLGGGGLIFSNIVAGVSYDIISIKPDGTTETSDTSTVAALIIN